MDSAKRMIELEAESNWLKQENRSLVARNKALQKQYLDECEEKDELIFKLKGEIMTVKRTQRMFKDKYVNARDRSEESDELIIMLEEEVRALKDKYVNMRDNFECGERKWSEAEVRCRPLEVEKRKLEMDLEAAVRGGNEAMEKLKTSEAMKDEYKKVVLKLIQRIEVLQREKSEMEAKVREKSEEIERILKEKMAMESQERKCIEVVKMIEEICRHWRLQVEKSKLEMDLEAALKVGDEEVVENMEADEALQRSLEGKYGTITMLLKKNGHVDAEKIKIEEELQDWVLKLRLEDDLKKCKGNGDRLLDFTEDDLIGKFATGVSMVTALSIAISCPTIAAAPHMFINAYKNALAIAVETDYSFPLADKVKESLADQNKFAMAAPPVEEEKEEPAKESDDDMGLSLFDYVYELV